MGGHDDDDDESMGGAFEQGHWAWDENTERLVFVSKRPPAPVDAITLPVKAPTGTIEFRDDIDLLEQLRFRKRYMRKLKPGEADVITVQDLKDLAIYTAPLQLMSPALIEILHLPTTERFIRALIFYCQYYLQTTYVMANRTLELETKIRTPQSGEVERVFRDNLCDLRTLVAKEYCTILLGGADTKKFHHMGAHKDKKSLSDKDARLFETLLRMCVQIVWLALSRRCFDQIELEVNRLFKSDIFNSVEHKLHTGFINKMTKNDRDIIIGPCKRNDQKPTTRSPLINEVFCERQIDYRMMGLGVIKYPTLDQRLLYMWLAIACPEEEMVNLGVNCGILGYPRSSFDTMLHVLQIADDPKSKSSKIGSVKSVQSHRSSQASQSSRKSAFGDHRYIYFDIALPEKGSLEEDLPASFPDESERVRPCSDHQRRQWLRRLQRQLNPMAVRRS